MPGTLAVLFLKPLRKSDSALARSPRLARSSSAPLSPLLENKQANKLTHSLACVHSTRRWSAEGAFAERTDGC